MAILRSVVSRVSQALSRTRETFVGGLRAVLTGRKLDDALIEELEERLIKADVGVKTTRRLVEGIRADHKAGKLATGDDVMAYLKRELIALWPEADRALIEAPQTEDGTKVPTVIFVAGVNGAGKTTSVAKIAFTLREQGKSVMLAACDTFRAGAVHQLEIWSERLKLLRRPDQDTSCGNSGSLIAKPLKTRTPTQPCRKF